MTEQPNNLSASETRNSKLREFTTYPIQAITGRLHEFFPDLEPNHITIAGIIGTGVGSLIALGENKKGASLSVLGASAVLDAFDGALARKVKTTQAVISRIETMRANPSLSLLKRIAQTLNLKLNLRFN